MRKRLCLFGLLCIAILSSLASADELTVAVAANFLIPSRALASEFESASGHQVALTSGATGQLYAQIINGAPYDILLAADAERPRLLAEQGLGDPASVFTYAMGQLALWSNERDSMGDETLAESVDSEFRWFAIPEPAVAPYGIAARQVLENLDVWSSLESKLVRGQNVAQTFAMIETGNAQMGLVALSQALVYEGAASYQVVSADLHDPIHQNAILLRRAVDNAAAREFLQFLRTPAAAQIILRSGYLLPGASIND